MSLWTQLVGWLFGGHRPTPTPPPAPARATVAVVVTTPAGIPISGATFRLNETIRTVTDANGYAAFEIEQGQVAYAIECEGYESIHSHVLLSENTQLQHQLTPLTLPVTRPPSCIAGRLRVESNNRWFANDAGRFDFREISAFSLLSRLLTDEQSYVRDYLRTVRGMGFTVVRVILTLDGEYWTNTWIGRSLRCAPDMPQYWERLTELCELAEQEGIYLRLVLFGDVHPFGGVWYPDRRDVWSGEVRRRGEEFAIKAAAHVANQSHVILELANEPGQIGMRDSFAALVALGRRVKSVAPQTLLGGGSVDGPNDNDTTFCVRPFDYVDAHIERRMEVGGTEWIKRSGEYRTIDPEHQPVAMPFISGEPVNFGEWRKDNRNGDVERNVSTAFAYGGMSRARQYNTNFHYDGGLYSTLPQDDTIRSIRGYMAALDAFPMLTGTRWRGHWAESYWQQMWPPSDDTTIVESHINAGKGPWRMCGVGDYCMSIAEPKGWDYRRAVRGGTTVERLAFSDDGQYNSAVYVRRT